MRYSNEKLLDILKRGFNPSEWTVLMAHSFLAAKMSRVETLDELEEVTRLGSDYLEDMARASEARRIALQFPNGSKHDPGLCSRDLRRHLIRGAHQSTGPARSSGPVCAQMRGDAP